MVRNEQKIWTPLGENRFKCRNYHAPSLSKMIYSINIGGGDIFLKMSIKFRAYANMDVLILSIWKKVSIYRYSLSISISNFSSKVFEMEKFHQCNIDDFSQIDSIDMFWYKNLQFLNGKVLNFPLLISNFIYELWLVGLHPLRFRLLFRVQIKKS